MQLQQWWYCYTRSNWLAHPESLPTPTGCEQSPGQGDHNRDCKRRHAPYLVYVCFDSHTLNHHRTPNRRSSIGVLEPPHLALWSMPWRCGQHMTGSVGSMWVPFLNTPGALGRRVLPRFHTKVYAHLILVNQDHSTACKRYRSFILRTSQLVWPHAQQGIIWVPTKIFDPGRFAHARAFIFSSTSNSPRPNQTESLIAEADPIKASNSG